MLSLSLAYNDILTSVRFYQVDNSANNEGHVGLGLPIVSEVVHAHGSAIDARSSPQEGTEFIVTLSVSAASANGSHES